MARDIETGRAKPIAIVGDDALLSVLKRITNNMGAAPANDPSPTPENDILQFRSEPVVITNLGANTGLAVYLDTIANAVASSGVFGSGSAGDIVIWSSAHNVIGISFPSIPVSIVTKSENYELTYDDYIVLVNGTYTITLPTAIGHSGQRYHIKNIGYGLVTIHTTAAQTIDDNLTAEISGHNDNIELVSNGSVWFIL